MGRVTAGAVFLVLWLDRRPPVGREAWRLLASWRVVRWCERFYGWLAGSYVALGDAGRGKTRRSAHGGR